jgi:hypothetical protein
MADSSFNSLTSNPLDAGSSTGGNIIGSNSNTLDDTSTSYQGSSSSTTSGGSSSAGGGLGQSPWGRLSEVGITDLGTLFSGVGSESGGGNPFANNPAAAQVLFGGESQGGSPFSNLRTNIDKLAGGNSTNGSNPMGGSGSTNTFAGGGISAQSADADTTSGITGGFGGSFGGGIGGGTTGDTSSIDLGGAFGGATSEIEIRSYIDTLVNSNLSEGGISSSLNVPSGGFGGGDTSSVSDPFAAGGAFGIPTDDSFDFASYGIPSGDDSFDFASYGIPTDGSLGSDGTVSNDAFSDIFGTPTDGSFDLASYGIPTDGSLGSGGAIPIEGGGIGGAGGGSGMPSFGGAGGGSGMPSFGVQVAVAVCRHSAVQVAVAVFHRSVATACSLSTKLHKLKGELKLDIAAIWVPLPFYSNLQFAAIFRKAMLNSDKHSCVF